MRGASAGVRLVSLRVRLRLRMNNYLYSTAAATDTAIRTQELMPTPQFYNSKQKIKLLLLLLLPGLLVLGNAQLA